MAMFTLTLLVGVVMAVLGSLRLGSLVRFISAEVQAGLVAAVAILIVLGQYDELVGYASKSSGGKVVKAADISAHVTSWHGTTTAVGLGCIVTLVLVKRSRWRAYADIVALVVGTLAVSGLGLRGVDTVGDVARIPTGLAAILTPHLPDVSLLPKLIPAAIAAAIVAVGGGDGRRRLPEPRPDPLGHVAGFLGPGAGQRRRWTVPRPAVGRVAVSDRRQRALGGPFPMGRRRLWCAPGHHRRRRRPGGRTDPIDHAGRHLDGDRRGGPGQRGPSPGQGTLGVGPPFVHSGRHRRCRRGRRTDRGHHHRGRPVVVAVHVSPWPTRPGSSPGFDGPTGAGRRPRHQPSCPRGRSPCWR